MSRQTRRSPVLRARYARRATYLSTAAVLGAVVVALVAGCATTQHPAPARSHSATSAAKHIAPVAPVTRDRTFVPFTASGAPAVRVTSSGKGTCWTTSIAAAVPGAYRCFAGNKILDPCFVSSPSATTALCVSSPWSTARRLTLKAALPNVSPGLVTARPWALQLANGIRCVSVTGTAPAVQGVSLGYACGTRYGAALTTRHGTVQSARYARTDDDDTLHTMRVAVVWHG